MASGTDHTGMSRNVETSSYYRIFGVAFPPAMSNETDFISALFVCEMILSAPQHGQYIYTYCRQGCFCIRWQSVNCPFTYVT